jgi:hypothetical protein
MDSKICRGLTAHVALRLRRAATQASCRRVIPALTGYISFNFCGNALTPDNLFQIDLPPYTDYQSLEQKLTLAVEYVLLRIFAMLSRADDGFAERRLDLGKNRLRSQMFLSRCYLFSGW